MVAQLVLMRELASSFAGNELVYGLSLAVWLLWVALGAHLAGRIAPRSLGAPFAGGLAASSASRVPSSASRRGPRPGS
jgi:hypothetical protein